MEIGSKGCVEAATAGTLDEQVAGRANVRVGASMARLAAILRSRSSRLFHW